MFSPADDPLREFRDFVVTEHERRRLEAAPSAPHVVLVATAFAKGSENVAGLLAQVSDILNTVLPSGQAITLIALLPPAAAAPAARLQTFQCFLDLEECVGTVPFLISVLVHQLPAEASPDPQHPSECSEEIQRLLERDLFDREASNLLRGVGDHALRTQRRAAGRKCCYSTLGCFELVYLPDETLRHIQARFQLELFRHGFFNPGSVAPDDLETIQRRVDAFVAKLADDLLGKLPVPPSVAGTALAGMIETPEADGAAEAFDGEVGLALEQVERPLEALKALIATHVESEVRDFVSIGPAYLGGIKHYIGALQGEHLVSTDSADASREEPSGMKLFAHVFCLTPLVAAVADAAKLRLADAAPPIEGGPTPAKDAQTWLDRAATAARGITNTPGSPGHFFAAAVTALLEHARTGIGGAAQVRQLPRELVAIFVREAAALAGLAKDIREGRAQIEAELQALHQRYGWLRRNLTARRRYQAERAQLQGQFHDCDEQLSKLQSAADATARELLTLVNSVVVPHIIRSVLHAALAGEIGKASQYFAEFVSHASTALESDWQQAAAIPQWSTSTSATIVTPERVEKLYQTVVNDRSMLELAASALSYQPQRTAASVAKQPAYLRCHSFAEHYSDAARLLVDRIRAYAEDVVRPLRQLGVLDVIEVLGKEDALTVLRSAAQKTKEFVPFALGMITLVQSHGAMTTHFLVRMAGGSDSRLAAEYDFLFEPHARFVDSRNPNVIDITCLIFGFPAFLIHALHEGRELARSGQEPPAADIWPL